MLSRELPRELRGLPLALCLLCLLAQAQEANLESGRPQEREVAGGESHTYQLLLTAGQFVRFRLDQQSLDSSLILMAPDGRQLAEVNLTSAGEAEPLALEAVLAGPYRLTVRGNGGTAMRGSYRLTAAVQASATPQERKYLAAQRLLLEGVDLANHLPDTAAQVLEKLEQSLPLWRELGDLNGVALTLDRIGKTHMRQNQNDRAIAYLDQALALYREMKNRVGEARLLNNLANAYFNLRQFDKAVESFEKSLALFREVKDRRWEGLTLYNLGNSRFSLNQPEKAIDAYDRALAILREVKDRSFEAQALNSLGNLHLNRGEAEKARAIFESAIAIFRELSDSVREGQTLRNLAVVNSRLGRSEKAIEILDQVLALFRAAKDRTEENTTLIALGTTYGGMGRTEKAIDYFQQVLGLSRELKDKRREAFALSNLGLAYYFLSQYEKAIDHLKQALPLTRETNNRSLEGSSFSYLGTCYAGLSHFEKAIESHEQALAIFRELKNRLFEGNTLQNLGSVYKFIGRDDKAIEYYDQSLAIFRDTKYRVGEGNVLSNLGNLYERLRQYENAIRSQEQALAIFRELKYRLGEGTSLMEIGVGHARQNRHEKAVGLYEQALVIMREVKEQNYEGLTLFRLAESKQRLGLTDEAVALLTETVKMMRAIGNRSSEIEPLTALARIEAARGNLEPARRLIEESVQTAESLRSDLVSPESRASLFAAVQGSYQFYTDLLMRQHKAEPTKGYDILAVEVSERRRARSLLDLLGEARADLRQGVDAALVTRERLLAGQLNDKAQQLARAAEPAQVAAVKQEISQLETDLERAQADIRRASPRYAALTRQQPLRLREMQQQLDADTLLLEYSLGEERTYLWAITRDSLTSYELPRGESIDTQARQVYELLTARSAGRRGETAPQRQQRIARAEADLPAAAQVLSQTLLAPVAARLGAKRLVIVADGALQYIPFAMLPDPAAGLHRSMRQPLIVNHEVVSLPSASALALQRAELAGRKPAPKMLAVIADPVFDRADARLKSPATETVLTAPAQAVAWSDERRIEHLAQKSDGDKDTTRRLVIPRLPFTRQEADRLLALAPKEASFQALDFQANRETVLEGELSQYRYVHFATHGLLDSERPGLSSLMLSMVDEKGKPRDGFLRANDIYNLRLPAELVVLSACQTGLGKEVRGEGLVGLTRGFMYAGAARIVVSLWNVNDRATAELMTKFYDRMLRQGARPAAALRAAQVEMWRQKQWQSPYYWAAFTLQGEWR